MKHRINLILVLAAILCTLQARAAAPYELPLLYQINSPLYDDSEWAITVYQTEDFSLAAHTPADVPAVVERDGQGATLEGQGPVYAVGDRTGARLAKGQRLNRQYFRIEERQALNTGERYSEMIDPADPRKAPFEREWWIENLNIDWQRGNDDREIAGLPAEHHVLTVSYDYNQIDHDDGERTDETVSSKREFWFASDMPFSPLQMLPLHIINDYRYVCFCSPGGRRVNDLVDARLEDEFRSAGLLLRTRFMEGDEAVTVEVSGLQPDPGLQLARYKEWPVIPASRETPAIGALMLHELLADAPSEGAGNSSVSVADSSGSTSQSLSGPSWFRANEAGDFAVANIIRTDDGARGMLLLMRPYHGLPAAGTYSTRPKPERAELETLDLAALKEQARYFQVVGLVEKGDALSIYTSTDEGRISITESSGARIEGEFSLEMDAIDTFGDGDIESARLTGQFRANEGLKARMRSTLGRLISQRQ